MRISDWSSDVCSSDLVLSYENLLRRPQETLEGLRDFLGVPPEEAQIAAAVAELTQGRRAANFDKWKQQMSRHDLRLFEGVAGAMLERYGYELSGHPAEIRWDDRLDRKSTRLNSSH